MKLIFNTRTIISFALVVVAAATQILDQSTGWKWEEEFGNKFRVKWRVDSKAEVVYFEISAETTGWVGFGVSKTPGMEDADIVIGGVANRAIYFKDHYAVNASTPLVDAQQDWVLESALELENATGAVTALRFWRKFDTGDKEDLVFKNEVVYFIWALGKTDEIEYHDTERGIFPVNIFEGPVSIVTSTEGTSTTSNNATETEEPTTGKACCSGWKSSENSWIVLVTCSLTISLGNLNAAFN